MTKKIALGADHAGFTLKTELFDWLRKAGHDVLDLGTTDSASTDYPDYAHAVSEAVKGGQAELGVLVCGTGVGMSMAANRHAGIRAVVCSETFSARMARAHNDANVLCIGARVVGSGVATEIVEVFLGTEFEGGRHRRRVEKIDRP